MFNTPILYIIFNRLDTVKQTFPKIAEQQPKQLFIAADGPRTDRVGEDIKCKEVREHVLSHIDWDCDVRTLFRDENLGCGENVHRAITWFFENVEQGIVLEDDCLPNSSFFGYCETLLNYYRDNEQIMHIAGDNPLTVCKNYEYSYYFANIMHCWGWASWSRAWKKYQYIISNVQGTLDTNVYFDRKKVKCYWYNIFTKFEKQPFKIDTWDYQWTYAVLKNNGICINPAKNLVQNIGFAGESTHFNNSGFEFSRSTFDINEIKHPKSISLNKKFIKKIDKVEFNITKSIYFQIIFILSRPLKFIFFKIRYLAKNL